MYRKNVTARVKFFLLPFIKKGWSIIVNVR